MEFNKKLQELRKQKGITQEELAQGIYVSRAAVSKWESGRGYPNIDSLKAIAKFFSVTVDELLSADQILTIAEENNKRKERQYKDLVFGLLDLSAIMLVFLPFFAGDVGGIRQSASLIELCGVQAYLKVSYAVVIIGMTITGILTLALQECQSRTWLKLKAPISLILTVSAVLLFIISSQPYAATFAFVLALIKALVLIKRR